MIEVDPENVARYGPAGAILLGILEPHDGSLTYIDLAERSQLDVYGLSDALTELHRFGRLQYNGADWWAGPSTSSISAWYDRIHGAVALSDTALNLTFTAQKVALAIATLAGRGRLLTVKAIERQAGLYSLREAVSGQATATERALTELEAGGWIVWQWEPSIRLATPQGVTA